MQAVVLGIVLGVVGLVLLLAGATAMRWVMSLVAAFYGFVLGAALATTFVSGGFLGTVVAWVCAIAGAIVLGSLAYWLYRVAVVLVLAVLGAAFGMWLAGFFGLDGSTWALVIGLAVGAVVGIVAAVTDTPSILLALLTAASGASTVVTAAQLLVGVLTVDEVGERDVPVGGLGWTLAWLALALVGAIVQIRALRRSRR
jgi:hypothetical protein